jgi:hypothetical protein
VNRDVDHKLADHSDAAGLLPPAMYASPAHLPDCANLSWWQPGVADVWRYVGWRWILLSPAIVLLLFLIGAWMFRPIWQVFFVWGVKLAIFVTGIAITLLGYVVRVAVRARHEPFCIHCGYCLSGLPDKYRCPECGRSYEWRVIQEYRRDPQWFIERWKAQQNLPDAGGAINAGAVRVDDGTGTFVSESPR